LYVPLGIERFFIGKTSESTMFMQKIKKFKFLKSPLLIAAIICFAIAIAIPLSVKDYKPEVKGISKVVNPTVTIAPSVTPTITVYKKESQNIQQTYPTLTPVPTTTTQTNSNNPSTSSGQATSTPAPAQAAQTFQVNLKINGSSVGNVDLPEGANQCDVLLKAKDQGKISQLLMKYDNALGTNGVYQINGQGKENSVWWTYKVNGQSPSQGCSLVKANSGESIEWEYKGN